MDVCVRGLDLDFSLFGLVCCGNGWGWIFICYCVFVCCGFLVWIVGVGLIGGRLFCYVWLFVVWWRLLLEWWVGIRSLYICWVVVIYLLLWRMVGRECLGILLDVCSRGRWCFYVL